MCNFDPFANTIMVGDYEAEINFSTPDLYDNDVITHAIKSMGFLVKNYGRATLKDFACIIERHYGIENPMIAETVKVLRKYQSKFDMSDCVVNWKPEVYQK